MNLENSFEAFRRAFQPDASPEPTKVDAPAGPLHSFLEIFQGQSFNQGLYRVHAAAAIPKWTGIVEAAFPSFKGRIQAFSHDWLGRHFAVDLRRGGPGAPQILLFEPGTAEVLEIDVTIEQLHNEEFIHRPDAALAAGFFKTWKTIHPAAIKRGQCVGYQVPIFLDGEDEVSNLAVFNMDVYWTLLGQLITRTRELPPGTRITDIH